MCKHDSLLISVWRWTSSSSRPFPVCARPRRLSHDTEKHNNAGPISKYVNPECAHAHARDVPFACKTFINPPKTERISYRKRIFIYCYEFNVDVWHVVSRGVVFNKFVVHAIYATDMVNIFIIIVINGDRRGGTPRPHVIVVYVLRFDVDRNRTGTGTWNDNVSHTKTCAFPPTAAIAIIFGKIILL